jgi:hypothetical protein
MNNEKWYTRKAKQPMGSYDAVRKRYFNSDSNKWVSRISVNDIKGDYKRFEFYLFDDRVIKKHFDYSNVDRIGKFLDLIFKRGKAREGKGLDNWIYIEVKEVNQLLGESYREDFIGKLIELDAIEVKVLTTSKYDAKKKLLVYRLSDNILAGKRREVLITNTKVKKFCNRGSQQVKQLDDKGFVAHEIASAKRITLKKYDLSKLVLNRIEDKQYNDTIRLDFDYITNAEKKDILFYKDKQSKKQREKWDNQYLNQYKTQFRNDYNLLENDLIAIKNNDVDTHHFSIDSYGGRLYNIITSKQKDFRKLMQIDGEDIVEIDMKNGYVSMFYTLCKRLVEPQFKNDKFNKLLKGIKNRDVFEFLDNYEIVFSKDSQIDFYFHAGIKVNKMTLLGGNQNESRLYMKGLVLWLLNSHTGYGEDKRYVDEQFSKEELGNAIFTKGGYQLIKDIKSLTIPSYERIYGRVRDLDSVSHNVFKNVSLMLNEMEVSIMQNIFKELIKRDIPYLSIFDGIVVKESDVTPVKNVLKTVLYHIDDSINFRVKKI